MTRRVLITGAAGFLAGHLATALRSGGPVHITGADARPVVDGRVDAAVVTDIFAPGALEQLLTASRPDEIYHLVGAVRGTDADIARSNVESARLLLSAAYGAVPGAAIVLVGSAAEYGEVPIGKQPVRETFVGAPTSAYGQSKRAMTALAETAARAGQRVMVARPFNAIGAGVPDTLVSGALIARLRDALAGTAPRRVKVGVSTSVRDFVDAADVAEGFIVVARRGSPGAAYNLCTGQGHAVAEVVDQLVTMAGGGIAVDEDRALSPASEVSVMVGSPEAVRALGWAPRRTFSASLRAAWDATAPTPAGR